MNDVLAVVAISGWIAMGIVQFGMWRIIQAIHARAEQWKRNAIQSDDEWIGWEESRAERMRQGNCPECGGSLDGSSCTRCQMEFIDVNSLLRLSDLPAPDQANRPTMRIAVFTKVN